MTIYTFSQLEKIWEEGGGSARSAPTMAAIAKYGESGGNASIVQKGQPYSKTGWGLWQITPGNKLPQIGTNQQLLNPITNARAAVSVYHSQGVRAWTDPIAAQGHGGLLTSSQIAAIRASHGATANVPAPASANIAGGSGSSGTSSGGIQLLSLPLGQSVSAHGSTIVRGVLLILGVAITYLGVKELFTDHGPVAIVQSGQQRVKSGVKKTAAAVT